MMNRGVLQRQMFANGGQAVPNEYKGFSKLPEAVQMRMDPVAAKKYQEGGPVAQGIATMAPEMGAAVPAMAAAPEGAGMIADQVMDPAALQEMLGGAAEDLQDLENAEDFETVMNSMRGDDATVEDRREELASLVGPEDAAQTPESVLALVQPVIMMAGIDQGIGGLAQEEMTQEVSGPMAEGIMSTVAPPQPAAPGPEMMGGPPPVNFNQGGLVRRGDNQPVQYYQPGGEVTKFFGPRLGMTPADSKALRQQLDAASDIQSQLAAAQGVPTVRPLKEIFDETKGTYASLLGGADKRAKDLEEQRNLTKAQMLFDIANTALAFAAPMEGERPGMSAGERLAMAARTTQLPQTIGARAQAQKEAERAMDQESRALDLAALQSAEATRKAEAASRSEYRQKQMELDARTFTLGPDQKVVDVDGTTIAEGKGQSFTLGVNQIRTNDKGQIIAEGPKEPRTHVLSKGQVLIGGDGQQIAEGKGETFNLSPGQVVKNDKGEVIATGPAKTHTLSEGQVIVNEKGEEIASGPGKTYVLQPGSIVKDAEGETIATGPEKTFTLSAGQKVVNAKGEEIASGPGKTFTLSPGQKVVNENGETVASGPAKTTKLSAGEALVREDTGEVVAERAAKPILKEVNGQLVLYNPATNQSEAVFGKPKPPAFKGVKITRNDGTETIVNANTEAGMKAIEQANADNENNPGTVNVVNLGTEARPKPKAFLIPGTGVVTSYDGGQTYTTATGSTKQMPQGPGASFPLSDTISYDIYRKESIRQEARDRLGAADDAMTTALTRPDGSIAPATDQSMVRNALLAARNATGPWANFSALLDGVVAGTVPSETIRNIFQDTQDNRQFVRALKILGSSALSVSPRMAVYDLARVERLFPDPDAFFRNPVSEANKLVVLKQIVVQQKTRNDQALAAGIDDATLQSEVIRKNFEIDRLLSLLEGVDATGGGLNQSVMDQIMQDVQGKR